MDDIIEAINRQLRNNIKSKDVLGDLAVLRQKAFDTIHSIRNDIYNSRETVVTETQRNVQSEEGFRLALSETIAEAPFIYSKNVKAATLANEEFDHSFYLRALLSVGRDIGLYNIVARGRGWKRTIIANLEMDQVAGDISNYSEAVVKVRAELAAEREAKRKTNKKGKLVKARVNNPETASRLWKGYYLNDETTYLETMGRRFGYLTDIAPFWSLLNYGNMIATPSDYGGTAYPNMSATHFVENTEKELERYFTKALNRLKTDGAVTKETSTVAVYRQDLEHEIDLLYRAISNLDQHVIQLENNLEEPDVYIKVLELDKEKVSTVKVLKAAAKVKQSKNDPNYVLPKNVEIGTKGNRKRMSSNKLSRLLATLGESE
jgi:hypothetical protein